MLAPVRTKVSAVTLGGRGLVLISLAVQVGPTGLRSTENQRGIIAKPRIAVLITGNRSPAGLSAALSPTKTGRAREEYAMCNLISLESSLHSFLSLAQKRGNS